MKSKLIFVLMALLFAGSPILAAVKINIQNRDVTERRTYDSDYIFRGENLNFSGKTRDLFFFSKDLNFTGSTELGVNGMAEDVNVYGNVNNGVKAAGRDILVEGTVSGTSFLAGANVTLGKQSRIHGDTFIAGRKVSILGSHKGNLHVGAAEVSVQNVVEGNVTAYAGQLQIPEGGKIVGNLTYHSEHELSREEAARVTGKIRFEKSDKGFFNSSSHHEFFKGWLWPSVAFRIAFIVFGLLILLLPINRFLENRHNRNGILSHALWGLIPIFMYPSSFIVSILLLITLPLALVLLLAFIPVVFITKVIGLTMLGGYLAESLRLQTTNRYLYFILAAVPYSLLSFIPIFGWLLMVFTTSIGCGWMLSRLFKRNFSRQADPGE